MNKRNKIKVGIFGFAAALIGVCSAVKVNASDIEQFEPSSNEQYVEDDETYGDLSIKSDLEYLGINMFDLPFSYTDYNGIYNVNGTYDDYTTAFLGAIPSDMGGMALYFWDNHNLWTYPQFDNVEISFSINDVNYNVEIQDEDWELPVHKHPYNEWNNENITNEWNPYLNVNATHDGWPLISSDDYNNCDYGTAPEHSYVQGDLKYHNFGVKVLKLYDDETEIISTSGEYKFDFHSISYDYNNTVAGYLHNRSLKYNYTACNRVSEYYDYSVVWKDSRLISGGQVSYGSFSNISIYPYNEITYTTINQTYTWHQTQIYCEKIKNINFGFDGGGISSEIKYGLKLEDMTTGELITNVKSIQFTSKTKKYFFSNWKTKTTVVDWTQLGNSYDGRWLIITKPSISNGFWLHNSTSSEKKACSFKCDYTLEYNHFACKDLNFVYCTYVTVGQEEVHGSFYEDGLHPEYDEDGNITGVYDAEGNLREEYTWDEFGTPIDAKTGKYVIAENQIHSVAKRTSIFGNLFSKLRLNLDFGSFGNGLLSLAKLLLGLFVFFLMFYLIVKLIGLVKNWKNS